MKRGHSKLRTSVGADLSNILGKAEKGKHAAVETRAAKRRREEEEAAAAEQVPEPEAPTAVVVENETGAVEELVMTWQQEMKDGQDVVFDGSSGIDMVYYINNLCLHGIKDGTEVRAVLSAQHSSTSTGGKVVTSPIAVLSNEQPHTALKGIRFHTSDSPTLKLKIAFVSGDEKEAKKARVTVCGEQMMRLNEAQIAALLM